MTEKETTPLTAKRFQYLGDTGKNRKMPGKGYTRFVRAMRLLLPLVAISIVGLLIAWPQLEKDMTSLESSRTDIPQTVQKNELVNPRFESIDDKKQPYTITASRAVQSNRDPSVVFLESPMADITLTDGAWLAAEANEGAYRQNAERLLLEGSVKLFHDRGYELKTEKLLVNLKNREAWSDAQVYGQGPAGRIKASGVKANAETQKLIFTGPVHLTLNKRIDGL